MTTPSSPRQEEIFKTIKSLRDGNEQLAERCKALARFVKEQVRSVQAHPRVLQWLGSAPAPPYASLARAGQPAASGGRPRMLVPGALLILSRRASIACNGGASQATDAFAFRACFSVFRGCCSTTFFGASTSASASSLMSAHDA